MGKHQYEHGQTMSTWGLWFNVPQDSLQHTVLPCSPPSGVIAPKDRGETLHESNGNKKSKYGLWEQILQELWPHACTHTPPFPGLGIAVPKQSWAANLENAEHKGKGLSNTFRNNAVCFVGFVWNSVKRSEQENNMMLHNRVSSSEGGQEAEDQQEPSR